VKSANEIRGEELYRDDLHGIVSAGRVVWCVVAVPERTPAAAGAAAAKRAGDYLIANVLQRRSPWLGLILDVRRGPSVFGPITRSVTVRMLEHAESAHKPFAVLTGGTTTQHQQYAALAASHAPRYALVTSEERQADDWMTAPRSGPLTSP
jgi:hypothetical protein